MSDCRSRGGKFASGVVPCFHMEIDHEIISKAILLPSADSRGFCQVTTESFCMKKGNIKFNLEDALKIALVAGNLAT